MELNELMHGFAEKIGLGEVKADESGAYALSFDKAEELVEAEREEVAEFSMNGFMQV